jgi:multiple sugar transport system substrate-binding protein
MKNYLIKLFSAVLCSALLAGVFAGCGSSSNGNSTATSAGTADSGTSIATSEPTETSSEPVTVKFWIRASAKESNQTITFDEFNNSQKNIKVEYQTYGDNYGDVIKLALNSGEVPDSFAVEGLGSIQPFVEAGYVYPLDEFITPEYKSQFNPSAFREHYYNGHVYAIPDSTRYIRLYYNKALFTKAGLDPNTPPKTLEEMQEFAKKITEAGKGQFYGFGLPIKSGSTWERNVDDIAILSGTTGPWAFDYTAGKFDFSKQAPVLKYFNGMFKAGYMMPGSESMDIEMVRANFATDKIGMYFDGNWMINGYNNELEAAKNLDYNTGLIPIFEGQKRAKDYLTLDSGRVITAKSEHKLEAYKVIQYMLENLYEAPVRKYPDKPLPALSLITAVNERVNSQDAVKNMKGITGALQEMENLSSFAVVPSKVLTLEGDDRNAVYPLLVMDGSNMEAQLNKLTETYNKALSQAIADGLLKEADLKPAGFSYYTR